MKDAETNLKAVTKRLSQVRLSQPKVTLRQAQAQAIRVMQAGKHSPLRFGPSWSGVKRTG